MDKNYLENKVYEDSRTNYFNEGLTILLSGPIAPMVGLSSLGSLGISLRALPDIGSLMPKAESSVEPSMDYDLLSSHILESTKEYQVPSAGVKPLVSLNLDEGFWNSISNVLESTRKYDVPSSGIGMKSIFDFGSNKSFFNENIVSSVLESTRKYDVPSAGIKSIVDFSSSFKNPFLKNLSDNIFELSKEFQAPSGSIKPIIDFTSSFRPSLSENLPESVFNLTKKHEVLPMSIQLKEYDFPKIDYANLIPKPDTKPEIFSVFEEMKKISFNELIDLPNVNFLKHEPKTDTLSLFKEINKEPLYKFVPTYTPPLILDDDDSESISLKAARKLIDEGLLERYKDIQAGLNLSRDAVSSLRLTSSERIPQFIPRDLSIEIPAVTPKRFDFLRDKSEEEYHNIAINSFLPHEQGHAKVFSIFKNKNLTDEDLKGFHEHLADTFLSKANVTPEIKTKMWEAESTFQESTFKIDEQRGEPYLKRDYTKWLKEQNPVLLGHHANIQELPNLSQFRQSESDVLKNSLTDLGYNPNPIIEGINNLTKSYKSASEKLYDFSQRFQFEIDSTQERISSILESIRKKTTKFMGDL